MTEREMFEAVRARYDAAGYCCLPQVRNQTGFSRTVRTADAIVVSLWPSRGIEAFGFEFKDSRADWLKELKDPAKAEEIGRFCSQWWVVASRAEIVRKEELPLSWGLMVVEGESVKQVVAATRRPAQEPGWVFVASVLRSASEVVTAEADIRRQVDAAVAKAVEGYESRIAEARRLERERVSKPLNELTARVLAFERASGVRLDNWSEHSNTRIGDAVRFVLDGGLKGAHQQMQFIADTCDRIKKLASEVSQIEVPGEEV
jgi:hypothetical protein